MRSSLPFFRLFPPPTFMLMPHVGLDISDDGIFALAYSGFGDARHISLSGKEQFPEGLFSGGDIKDEKEFISRLSGFREKHGIRDVKVSVPEEKGYLFHTEVPSTDQKAIEQNIEFKLEENVPLSPDDAVFYFDLLPQAGPDGAPRASVSVVPRTYIERYTAILKSAGMQPVSFEIVPKALARAVIPYGSDKTRMIIHAMSRKTGIYIVSGNVINFTFTGTWAAEGKASGQAPSSASELLKEINRIRLYWVSHGSGLPIEEIILVGRNAETVAPMLSARPETDGMAVKIADVWCNATDINRYLPPVTRDESLQYAVAAGLAFDTHRSA